MSSKMPTAIGSIRRLLLLVMLFVCVFSAGTASAQPRPFDLLLEGRGDDYLVCYVTFDPQQKLTVSSIRQRIDSVAGRWTEIARLQTRVLAMAALDERIAVLTEDGEIRLLRLGGGTLVSAMPGSRRPVQIASDNGTLWAIGAPASASSSTKPSTTKPATTQTSPGRGQLLRWNGSNWTIEATLPLHAPADPSLAIYAGVPHIAYAHGGTTHIDQLVDSEWKPFRSLPATEWSKLIPNAGKPLVTWVSGDKTNFTVFDLTTDPPAKVQSFTLTSPLDIGVVTGNLRAIYTDGDKIQQIGFYDLGRGGAFGPSVIANVASAEAAAKQSQWMQLIVMALMTIAMVLTLRAGPPVPIEVLERAGLRLAPLGRRMAAGLIDAIPYVAAALYVSKKLDGAEAFEVLPGGIIPLMVGMAVYIIHVTIEEMIWGRSIGKMLFGMRVVMNDGSALTPGRAFLRNIMRVLDVALYIPLVFVLISPLRQRIGDLAAGTLVVTTISADDKPTGDSEAK